MALENMRQPIESGCPDALQYMHPVMLKNFGNWKYHEDPEPGVLRHVAHSGDEVWTVRAGTQRILDVYTVRKLCDIGDQFADGYIRFTIRSNIEFLVTDPAKVPPLIGALRDAGFIVGGTRNSVTMISHTQGFLHCDIPATDASGVVKSMMDELVDEFQNWNMPNRVHIATSCCQINCGGQADIAINIQHTKPPRINHDLVSAVCERPTVVARCPVAAIRPAQVNGKPTLEVDEKKCICCGACFPPCPPMQINHAEHSQLAIWVGGNHSNARSKPSFQKLVAAGIPNNPPRWPEATAIVKKILHTYKEDAKDWERINDWIDRIGWPRFFEKTGLPFTKYHVDNWRGARKSLNASAHIRF